MTTHYTFDADGVAKIRAVVRQVLREGRPNSYGNGRPTIAPLPYPVDDDAPAVDLRTTPDNETARTATWTIGAGSVIKRCWRPVYAEAGDQILYWFYWDERIDAYGRTTYIGPETRFTANTPTIC